MRMTSRRIAAAGLLAAFAAGCSLMAPERERRHFDCRGVPVIVSTKQRVPDWFGGEEYVYATTPGQGGVAIKNQVDNNGRWTDRLGTSMAEDGSWVRFHVMDQRGEAAGRFQYVALAFVEVPTGTVIRTAIPHSSDEERASLFTSSATLPAEQTIRGRQVAWQPCDDRT